MANQLILHTGTNLGDREKNLIRANDLIEHRIGKITKYSSLYETEPWGIEDQPAFINQAIELNTELSPEKVLAICNKIEEEMGRIRVKKWERRLIDIDIIFYGEQIVKTDQLQIPHRHIQDRNFVLIPLMEIIPDFNHPVLNISIEELYEKSTDTLEVFLLNLEEE